MSRELRDQRLRVRLLKSIQKALNSSLDCKALRSLLAEVRILIDIEPGKGQYAALKFHCDWMLHATMSKGEAQEILKRIDAAWDDGQLRDKRLSGAFAHWAGQRLGFLAFEQQLRDLLLEHNVNLGVFASNERHVWLAFEELYCEAVKECFLEYPDNKPPLKHINSATVRAFKMSCRPDYLPRGPIEQTGDHLPYVIEWIVARDEVLVFKFLLTVSGNVTALSVQVPIRREPRH